MHILFHCYINYEIRKIYYKYPEFYLYHGIDPQELNDTIDYISFFDKITDNNTLTLSVAGQSYPVSYTLQNNNTVLNIMSAFDSSTNYSYDFTTDDCQLLAASAGAATAPAVPPAATASAARRVGS